MTINVKFSDSSSTLKPNFGEVSSYEIVPRIETSSSGNCSLVYSSDCTVDTEQETSGNYVIKL